LKEENMITVNSEASTKLEKLKQWQELKSKSCLNDKEIASFLKTSRSTLFEWKRIYKRDGLSGLVSRSRKPKKLRETEITEELENLVLNIRKKRPHYGKGKIWKILKRFGAIKVSISTIGRVLTQLKGIGLICKVYYLSKENKKRKFNKHAQRFEYGMKAKKPGELVQIDHMSVSNALINNTVKHFAAIDPISKYGSANVYSNAKSLTAAKFLDFTIKRFPFPITSIQVDGGSEFMDEFEKACKERNIKLYVLPPKKPKWNGGVERSNKTFRNEFYDCREKSRSINDLREELADFVEDYNTFRPHFSLDYETPLWYYENVFKKTA
jgi:putative transposase